MAAHHVKHLSDRRRAFRDRIVGQQQDDEESRPFHDERRRMVDTVGRAAQTVVDTYDRRREASQLADGARNAVATAAAAGAGALGLGTLITIAASTAAADVTGILLASVVAALGFFVIPARRSKAKAEMRAKIADVRARLSSALGRSSRRRSAAAPRGCARASARTAGSCARKGRSCRRPNARLAQLSTDLRARRRHGGSLGGIGLGLQRSAAGFAAKLPPLLATSNRSPIPDPRHPDP